jgi:hypothetical protein
VEAHPAHPANVQEAAESKATTVAATPRARTPLGQPAIDAYEGVPDLFERVRIRARSDCGEVDAYAYQWVRRKG